MVLRTSRLTPASTLTFTSLGQWPTLTRSPELSNSMSNIISPPSETWKIQIPSPSNLLRWFLENFHHDTRIARNLCLLIIDMSPFLASSDITYKPHSQDVIECFTVSIDHIAFLGQQVNSTAIPNTLDSKSCLPTQFSALIDVPVAPFKMLHCGKNLIDYKCGRSTMPITTTTISSTTLVTLTPTQGPPQKRPWVEADQSPKFDLNDIYA